jgi:uncharacterized membrane protein
MPNLTKPGRIFFAVAVVAIGVQQLFYAGFRPVILPAWPSPIAGAAFWAGFVSVIFIIAGIAILLEKNARMVSLVLGFVFLLLFCFGHSPFELFVDPYGRNIGTWTNALKELALSGGAFAVARSFPRRITSVEREPAFTRFLEKIAPLGSIFFSITMTIFGIDHFLYAEWVAKLVPAWMPFPIFWTYFAGVALAGSGIAIILKIRVTTVATLLGIMIFLWLILLHIPRAIADPFTDKGNEVTSVFEALGFSGIAFVIAGLASRGKDSIV